MEEVHKAVLKRKRVCDDKIIPVPNKIRDCNIVYLVMCWLQPEAISQAKPSQRKLGQAGPDFWLEPAFGLAWDIEKPKLLA